MGGVLREAAKLHFFSFDGTPMKIGHQIINVRLEFLFYFSLLVSVTPASQDQFNWLTAEDILNAAEDSDYKITHSPIILIPYDEEEMSKNKFNLDVELGTVETDILTKNFAILDALSNQLQDGNEISNNKVDILERV